MDYLEEIRTIYLHPRDGRYILITKEARRIIDLALAIPGNSPYLFHDKGPQE